MKELTPIHETDSAIPAKLDVAKRALEEATTDWERVDIRDYARAVAAATAIIKRKDIQVQAANLVQDAERAIAKANPPMTNSDRGKIRGKGKKEHTIFSEGSVNSNDEFTEPVRDKDRKIVVENLISETQLRHMRQAHYNLSDEEFEEKKMEAEQTGIPLTQSSLREEARRKRIEKQRKENREQRNLLIENPPPLPPNQYRSIVIDPPWPIAKIEREVRPNQKYFDYPTMSIEEIQSLDLPLADDAFIFLWTTQKYLPDAFRILESWELTYRFTMVWVKNGGIQPYNSAQFNCEFVLLASKGNPIFADLKRFNTASEFKAAFKAQRQGHSVKPDEFYDLIRRVTLEPRLDMFSRREIEGFDVWGNEVC